MNARKGDVILSPGGTGLIGMLLRSASPGQLYSHAGIMTRNYDEVTHSTGSEEVITDYITTESPKNGLPANMIKYMWPGVVTQPVEAAVNGEDYLHPELGKAFSISSFSAHAVGVTNNDKFIMVPPLVVKPDPMVETDEVRTKLHQVADSARSNGYRPGGTPRSHYRLFSYSDPTIGQTTTAPAGAGWDLANQLCNTFANDDARGQDSDAWRYQKDANAISPADILWWDGPEKGGVYGYAEPLIYREPREEPYTVSRWKKVLGHGTIAGNVTCQGIPAAGVNVRVYEGKSDLTNASGKFSLGDVPLGTYNLLAWAVIEGKYCSITKSVTLDAESLSVSLVLQPPADDYRLVSVYFDFWGEDDETFGASEHCDPGPELMQFGLGPDRLVDSFHRKYSWGGELRAEYKFTIKLLVGNIADVQVDCTLYEGTSEKTRDLAGRGSTSIQVGMDQTGAATLHVWNREESSRHDQSTLTVSVKNEQNNN